MHLADIERRTSSSGAFEFYVIGDLHADRREFNLARFERWRAHIISRADFHPVVVFVGDAVEGRTPGMQHFEIANVRPDFLNNMESYVKHGLWWCAKLLKPITDAGIPLVVIEGNHDRYMAYSGFSAMLADRVGASYLGGEGFIRIRSGRLRAGRGLFTTLVYATHGSGGGKKPGGKLNAMQSTLEWVDADIVVKGHQHDGMIRVLPRYSATRAGVLSLTKSPVALYRAPSFVERARPGLVNYAGRKEFPATDEGLMWAAVNPQEKTITRHELPLSYDVGFAAD